METRYADKDMMKFFERLLNLKKVVTQENDLHPSPFSFYVYNELCQLIQEKVND